MTDTINADRYDITRLAFSYENLMHMFRTGHMDHVGSNGPRNTLNTYVRLSQKLGVCLINEFVLERLDAMIIDTEERRAAAAAKIFGAKQKETA